MNRKLNIDKILREGRIRKKALLLINSHAEEQLKDKPILTRAQVNEMRGSLKTEMDGEIWNRFINYEAALRTHLVNLNQAYLSLLERTSCLKGLFYLETTQIFFLDLLNTLCYKYGEEIRDRILEEAEDSSGKPGTHIGFITNKMKPSEESPFLKLERPQELQETYQSLKETILELMTIIKVHIVTGYEFMERTGAKIKVYKEFIKQREDSLREEDALLQAGGFAIEPDVDKKIKIFKEEGLSSFFPQYDELPIDKKLKKSLEENLEAADQN